MIELELRLSTFMVQPVQVRLATRRPVVKRTLLRKARLLKLITRGDFTELPAWPACGASGWTHSKPQHVERGVKPEPVEIKLHGRRIKFTSDPKQIIAALQESAQLVEHRGIEADEIVTIAA